ncbi:MAG TPA: hypothetical protein VF057_01295 [Thermoanaerobaculia bacterium]
MDKKSGLGLLIVVVTLGALVLAGERFPIVKRATEFAFGAIEILLAIVLIGVLGASAYFRRKHPELAAAEDARRLSRQPNPHWRGLVAAFAASFVGFGALTLSAMHAFRDPQPKTAWLALAAGAIAFGASLLFALPRLHRFGRHSAEQMIRDLAPPTDPST